MTALALVWAPSRRHVFETTDVAELGRLREETLLAFVEVVEKAGAAFGGP